VTELIELKELMYEIRSRYNLTPKQVFDLIETKEPGLFIPLALFSNRKLGVLETVVKYMRENMEMSFGKMAVLLKRDYRTIWCTYDKAKKKDFYRFKTEEQRYLIPIEIFADRKHGVLEALARYCRDELKLSNSEIAHLIKRDNRTVWTVLHR